MAAITSCSNTDTVSTTRATLAMSPMPSERVSVCAIRRVRRRDERLTISPSSVAAVIMPKPPSWNNTMIDAWPKPDQ